MRRLLAVLAASALTAALAACGTDAPAPEPQQEQPVEASDDSAEEAEEATGSDASEPSGPPEEASEDGTDAPQDDASDAAPATEIVEVWIDEESWTVEEVEDDLCAMGGAHPSAYSEQDDVFTCGPNAASAMACALDDDELVVCITNPVDEQAISFESPTAAAEGVADPSGGGTAMPLTVTLANGATCATISHDHDQHWEDMFSWYRCDDGSELLTDDEAANTFDRDETWTAQRSVDMGAPEEIAVLSAAFAGR